MPNPTRRRKTRARHAAPRARHAAPRGPLRQALTALAVVAALVALTGTAGAVVAYYKLSNNLNSQDISGLLGDRPDVVAEPQGKHRAQNILLIGSDTRAGANSGYGRRIEGARSDTTIMLHLAADRKSAVLVSIPRDSVVDIPDCRRGDGTTTTPRRARINEAYSLGGAACTIRTVESLTDVHVDHYVVIDFSGFKHMVDALDGVEICLPKRVDDSKSQLHLDAGRQTVKGRDALAYVRTRHGLGDGSDLSRIDRQQAFLSSLVNKVQSTGLLRADRLFGFLDAATKSITTDPDLGSLNDLRKLAKSVQGLKSDDVSFVTVPHKPDPDNPQATVVWDETAADALWSSLRFDRPLPGQEKSNASASPDPTASSTAGPPLKTPPERIRVRVLNGSGVTGAASRLAEKLAAEGFQITGVATADRDDYPTTTVRYDPAYDESGRTLSAALSGSTLQEDSSLSGTLVVTIGADDPQVVPVQVAGSTATPRPTTSIKTRKADQDICS